MPVSEDILVRLRAVGQAAFTGAMNQAAGSIGKVTSESKQADKAVGASADTAAKQAPKWKTMAGQLARVAGGAALLYSAKRGIEASLSSTEELGKATLALQRNTGMDVRTASQWAEVTRVRGINSKQFSMGLVALSRNMQGAAQGTKASVAAFKQLGVSQQAIRSGNTQQVILQTADAFERMRNPAQRAALAQKLFGRQGQALLPLLSSGSAGIREQLGLAQRYGAAMGGTSVAAIKENIARQRELKYAMDGLKVSLGTALLPVIDQATLALAWFAQTFQPLLRNATLVKIVLGALTAAFLAYRIAVIASTIASLSMISVWALIPLAIVAIGVALVVAYRKVGWFRRAVQAVFGWIKNHWPLLVAILTGPIGAAVIVIVRHFGRIRSAVGSIVGAVRRIPHAVAAAFNAAKAAAGRIANDFFRIGKNIVTAIVNGIRSAPGAILGAIKGLIPGGILKKIGGVAGLFSGQYGGIVPPGRPRWGIVGEAGPELVQLPGATRVTPLPAPRATAAPAMAAATHTTAHFYLDRRLIATAVAQDTADRQARR